ncbi:MAG: ABC transporter permease [Nitrososphaerota archaeon]|nr:ABC transporter permease [Candidatus Bathyarchaeota archaeon]MDW8048559.1 ABC transporter permease [Nitrososphaerota archaeon]
MNSIFSPLKIFYMAVWRNLLTLTRYKVNFLFSIITSALWAAGMLLFSLAFDSIMLGRNVGTTNYVAFIVFGISFQSWQGTALWGAANMLQNELGTGQIEYTFTCPFSRYRYIVSNVAALAVQDSIFFLPMFCFGLWLANTTLTIHGLLLGLASTILSVAALVQWGVIFAALTLRYRQVTAVFSFFNFTIQMFSGMFIPLQILPAPLQIIGFSVPVTFGMDLLRHYVMETFTIFNPMHEWVALLVQLALLSMTAKFVVSYLEGKAKEKGLHYI